jgi:hypothetical protein
MFRFLIQHLSFISAPLRRGAGLGLVLLAGLLATAPLTAQAQTGGVRIGTPGPPDVSAALDIVSSSKGALLPRVADATTIATPATGLLVFQTGGTPGFYYNAGTPSVPNWQQLATAAGVPTLTAGNGLTKTGNAIGLGGTLSQATTVAQGGNNFSLTGGNVGIGTTSPTQPLEVAGQVFSNSGGFRFPDNTVQTTAAISPVATASNGLTKTGTNLVLGGTLNQATTISQGGNTFSLSNNGTSGAAVDQQQLVFNGSSSAPDIWQSFTAGASGMLTQLDLNVMSPTSTSINATLSVYAGNGTGGALLTTQAVVLTYEYNRFLQFTLNSPVLLAAGQQYTYRLQTATSPGIYNRYATGNPYAGGSFAGGTADCGFITYVAGTTNVLTALASGNVGIGTSSPTQPLEVAGQVFSNSGGFRFPDNTVQTTASTNGTASNGLTQSGNSIVLGGTLTQATTISQGGNTFSLSNSGTSNAAIDQQQLATTTGLGGSSDNWQSFTAGVTGNLVQLDLRVSSPNGSTPAAGTLSIYAGEGTGGALLSSQAITYNVVANAAYQSYALATPVAVVANRQYTYRFEAPSYGASGPGTPFISLSSSNPYAGGRSNVSASWDDCFKTYVAASNTTAVLTALASGNVGIGTTAPSQKLDVTGNTNVTGSSYVGGSLGVGTTAPATALDVRTADASAAITVGSTGNTDGAVYFGNPSHGVKRNYSNGNDVGLYTTAANLYLSASGTSTSQFVLLNSGNVGIGTTPGAKLHVAGNMKIDGTNTLEFGAGVAGKEANAGKIGYRAFSTDALDIVGAGTAASGGRLIRFYCENGASFNGQVNAPNFYNSSDQRFKQNIRPIGSALASVLALRGVRYEWNALGIRRGGKAGAGQVGLIAQELEKVYPELVFTDKDGYKSVNYTQLTPVLIEALKEQQAQIETLKAQAAAAKAQAATATATTEAFEARLRALEAAGGPAHASR